MKRTALMIILAGLSLAACGSAEKPAGTATVPVAIEEAAAPVEVTTTTVAAVVIPAPVAPKPATVKPAVVKPAPAATTTTTAPPAPVTTTTTAPPVVETTTTTVVTVPVEAGFCSIAVAKSPVTKIEAQVVTITSNRPNVQVIVGNISYAQSPMPASQKVMTDAAGTAPAKVYQKYSYGMGDPGYQQAKVTALLPDGTSCFVRYDVA